MPRLTDHHLSKLTWVGTKSCCPSSLGVLPQQNKRLPARIPTSRTQGRRRRSSRSRCRPGSGSDSGRARAREAAQASRCRSRAHPPGSSPSSTSLRSGWRRCAGHRHSHWSIRLRHPPGSVRDGALRRWCRRRSRRRSCCPSSTASHRTGSRRYGFRPRSRVSSRSPCRPRPGPAGSRSCRRPARRHCRPSRPRVPVVRTPQAWKRPTETCFQSVPVPTWVGVL